MLNFWAFGGVPGAFGVGRCEAGVSRCGKGAMKLAFRGVGRCRQVVVEGDRTRRARLPPHERLDLCVVRIEDSGVVVVVDVLPGVADHAEAVAVQREARAPRVLDVDGCRRRVNTEELTWLGLGLGLGSRLGLG